MPRVSGGPHPHARARSAHGAQVQKPSPQLLRVLYALVVFTVLLVVISLFSNQSSDLDNGFHSADIDEFLFELDEQIRAAGSDAPQMQLRLLRQAAGQAPEHPDRATRVFSELLSSLASLGHTLPCLAVAESTGDGVFLPQTAANATGCSEGCFFAANLHNSAHVLPNMILQLLAALGSLGGGEHARRCFVSVYESGSTDTTAALLDMLRRTLDVLGVPNRVITGGIINRQQQHRQRRAWFRRGPQVLGGDDRIKLLADLRNAVLEPLLEPCGTGLQSDDGFGADTPATLRAGDVSGCVPGQPRPMDRVIFINDVFFCAYDVRRLLRYESADVVCGLDFVWAKLWLLTEPERRRTMAGHLAGGLGVPRQWAEAISQHWLPYIIWKKVYGKTKAFWAWSILVFYDMWVARDMSGGRLHNREPYSLEPWTADRLAQGMPTPAYCCWNGLVNLRAAPFRPRPRTGSETTASTAAASDAAASTAAYPTADYSEERRAMGEEAPKRKQKPQPVRFRSHAPGECASSECSLMCDDLHAAGYHRVLIEPNVRVTYDWSAAASLYNNFDLAVPENVRGLRYQPMAPGDPRQVEVNWSDDWLPRVEAGARSVECCGIQPGKETADFDHGCSPLDMTESWWTGEPPGHD